VAEALGFAVDLGVGALNQDDERVGGVLLVKAVASAHLKLGALDLSVGISGEAEVPAELGGLAGGGELV
jgi:hypothetical protein